MDANPVLVGFVDEVTDKITKAGNGAIKSELA
jgi:hypothetical protein